jgi:hypothetical protein
MRKIASNQLIVTEPGWLVYRDLYVDNNGNRVSVRLGAEFPIPEKKLNKRKGVNQ